MLGRVLAELVGFFGARMPEPAGALFFRILFGLACPARLPATNAAHYP